MPFTLTCPKCDARTTVPDEVAGKRLRCQQCAHIFRAGSADVDVVEDDKAPEPRPPTRDADDRPRRRPRDDADDDRPARRARRSGGDRGPAKGRGKKRRSALPLVLGLVAVVVLGGGGLAAYLLTGRGTPTEYTDPEGMFAATFPNPPAASTVIDPTGPGPAGRIGERVAHAQVGEDIYSVTVLGPFTPSATVGPRWRDQQLQRFAGQGLGRGEEVVNRSVVHDGHTGTQMGVLRPDGWTTITRVVAGERYVLRFKVVSEVGTLTAAEKFVATAEKFFESVRVGPAFGAPLDQAPAPVSAAEVAAAYRADPAAADAKYKGRYFDLTVRVTGLRTTDRGQVVGVESNAGSHVLEFSHLSGVDGIKPGDTLNLTGQCAGLEREKAGPPRIRFEVCQLLAPDGSIARPPASPPSPAVPKAVTRDPPKTPGGSARPPTGATPPALTAAQRKILGKWQSVGKLLPKTVEFKADGEMIRKREWSDGAIKPEDDNRRTFRFLDDQRFQEVVNGIDFAVHEIKELTDTRLVTLNTRFGNTEAWTRAE